MPEPNTQRRIAVVLVFGLVMMGPVGATMPAAGVSDEAVDGAGDEQTSAPADAADADGDRDANDPGDATGDDDASDSSANSGPTEATSTPTETPSEEATSTETRTPDDADTTTGTEPPTETQTETATPTEEDSSTETPPTETPTETPTPTGTETATEKRSATPTETPETPTETTEQAETESPPGTDADARTADDAETETTSDGSDDSKNATEDAGNETGPPTAAANESGGSDGSTERPATTESAGSNATTGESPGPADDEDGATNATRSDGDASNETGGTSRDANGGSPDGANDTDSSGVLTNETARENVDESEEAVNGTTTATNETLDSGNETADRTKTAATNTTDETTSGATDARATDRGNDSVPDQTAAAENATTIVHETANDTDAATVTSEPTVGATTDTADETVREVNSSVQAGVDETSDATAGVTDAADGAAGSVDGVTTDAGTTEQVGTDVVGGIDAETVASPTAEGTATVERTTDATAGTLLEPLTGTMDTDAALAGDPTDAVTDDDGLTGTLDETTRTTGSALAATGETATATAGDVRRGVTNSGGSTTAKLDRADHVLLDGGKSTLHEGLLPAVDGPVPISGPDGTARDALSRDDRDASRDYPGPGVPRVEASRGPSDAAIARSGDRNLEGITGPFDGESPVPDERTAVALLGLVAVGAAIAGSSKAAAGLLAVPPGPSLRLQARAAATSLRGWLGRVPRYLPVPGYSRHDSSDPLENERRTRLYDAITDSPGTNLATLVERTGVSRSTARYHLRILEHEGLVTAVTVWGNHRLYPVDAEESHIELQAALRDETKLAVLEAVARHGPADGATLADELDRDPSTVSHHLTRLADAELVEREREGGTVLNRLTATARSALRPTPPEATGGDPTAGPAD